MIELNRDLTVLFSGVANNRYIVFGLTPEGEVMSVFDPHTQGNDLWPAKPFEISRSIGTGSEWTRVGDDFYMTYNAFWITPGSDQSLADYNSIVIRLTAEGVLEAIAELPDNWSPRSQGFGKAIEGAEHQGAYYVEAAYFESGNSDNGMQIFRVTPEGAVDQVTAMPTPPTGLIATGWIEGLVSIGDDLVFFADRRFPRAFNELWRLDAQRQVELLYESNTLSVIDIQDFADATWFVTLDRNGFDPITLRRYTPGEGIEQIPLPDAEARWSDWYYLTVTDDRLLMYGRDFIDEIHPDGTVTTLLNRPITHPDSVAIFNDTLYFTNSDFLYRVSDTGVASRVQGFDGAPSWGVETRGLTVSGDQLFFIGNAETTGSFGEPIRFNALYSMDSNETITRLTGIDTSAPDIYDMGNIFSYQLALSSDVEPQPPEAQNTPALIAGDTTGRVVEDDVDFHEVSGVLIVTDPDAGEDQFASPDAGSLTGNYGRFAFDPDTGAWTYTLDNSAEAVQALPEGGEVTDSLTVNSLDGTASETITVIIQGSGVRTPENFEIAQLQGSVHDRAGVALDGVSVIFTPDGGSDLLGVTSSTGRFAIEATPGLSGRITATREYNPETDGNITALDALNVLRLSVGLAPSWGNSTPMDFIAADINQDGQVTALDALEVLRSAVGLQASSQPRWIFIDADADLSSVDRGNTDVEIGVRIDALTAGLMETSMTGVLLGGMQEYA